MDIAGIVHIVAKVCNSSQDMTLPLRIFLQTISL